MKKYRYEAFGLAIASDFRIPQLTEVREDQVADVIICSRDMSDVSIPLDRTLVYETEVLVSALDAGKYRVTGGKLIEADKEAECSDSYFALFLMGSCMGAILHQRGYWPMHGSCVTDGKHSILITGDSGAGKSTTAAEFLQHGWKLLTDDVTLLTSIDPPTVQSSYPSQKLWQDALDRHQTDTSRVHSLYSWEDEEKFGVDVADQFFRGTAPLSLIVRLLPYDAPTQISPIEGMAKVDQLMRNTYRMNMILKKDMSGHFQRCVTMSSRVPMALMIRNQAEECTDTVYCKIVEYLERVMEE